MGEAVEAVGHEKLQVHEDGVRGQGHVTHLGAPDREVTEGDDEREGAQEDVEVDAEQRAQAVAPKQPCPVPTAARPRQCPADDNQPECGGRDLGDQAGPGDALDAPAEADHEDQVEHDVDAVERDLEQQHGARPLGAEQPAEQGVVDQRRRRAPDADLVVAAREAFDLRARFQDPEGDRGDGRLQDHQKCAQGHRQDQRAQERGAQLVPVVGAEGLGREPGRPHAQEAEAPEQEVEEHRADRHAADVGGIGQPADHRGVDRAQKRRRQGGEHDRHRQRPDPAVPAAGGRAGKRRRAAGRGHGTILNLVGPPGRAAMDRLRAGDHNDLPAPPATLAAEGSCLGLKSWRSNARNIGFSADHVCFPAQRQTLAQGHRYSRLRSIAVIWSIDGNPMCDYRFVIPPAHNCLCREFTIVRDSPTHP